MTSALRSLPLAALACAIALGDGTTASAQCMSPRLSASQVVPPASATGAGLAFFQIDTEANELFYDLTMIGQGLFETASHIHGFATAGSNAPVLFTLPLGFNKTGTWVYPENLEAGLLAGLAYVDVHTVSNPLGHLRGQLVTETSDATLYARLTGAELIPPQTGPGQEALVVMNLDTAADVATLDYQVYPVAGSFSSQLLGYVPAGQIGSTLTFLTNFSTVTWSYPEAAEGQILSGLTYAENYGGSGPLARGQVHLKWTKVRPAVNYCTAGTSAAGCSASVYAWGYPSATAPADFHLKAAGAPALANGIFLFGANGRQAQPWGNGSSFQCAVPPVYRAGPMTGSITAGLCKGSFSRDLNAHWCPTCPKASHNPGAGSTVQAQLWYRDPASTSNQTTSLSDALEFTLAP